MGRPPLSIDVAPKDQKELAKLLSGGVQQVRVVLRALALLQLARGASAPRIASVVPLTPQAIRNIGHRYQQGGLERRSLKSSAPARLRCWTPARSSASSPWFAAIRPKATRAGPCDWWPQEAVKRRLAPRVGRETIRVLLQHHDLKPWREKNVVVRRDKPAWS